MYRKLYRSRYQRMICGVCAGIAEYLGIDPTTVRLIYAALSLFTLPWNYGAGIVLYIILWRVMPVRPQE